ncbi:MAG: DUF445 domain-containing protein [Oscillochloris sp.]|nr:DUF445 domain-containing protein [Oscillochloris sp.]
MDDTQRAVELRKMQRLATGLLIAVTLLFALTSLLVGRWPWLGFIRAFAEASMIGALADWFAVTALFRHPMGIPIPHTAIIPERKERIAESFGRFVESNFLDPEKIAERLQRQDLAVRLARTMRQPSRANQVADLVAEILGGLLKVANDEDVEQLLAQGLSDRLGAVPVAPLLGRVLQTAAADQRHREILLQVMEAGTVWIEANQMAIRKRIASELPRWLPPIVDQKIYEKLLDSARRMLGEISMNPNHPLYDDFTVMVDNWIENLQHDPQVRERGEALKAEFLAQPLLREVASSAWQDFKAGLVVQSSEVDSPLRQSIASGLAHLGDVLERQPEWRAKVDTWLEGMVRFVIGRYGRVAGEFITQTVNSWDTMETSRKIELQFGRDLQFIRINGTVVGGLAGLVIYTISLFL